MRVFCLIVLLAFFHGVSAVDSQGNYAIWGPGNKSCHRYNLTRAAGEDDNYRNYIMGYLTSYNQQAQDTYSISRKMNLDEILNLLDEECQLKPVVSFDEALINFIIEHHEDRLKSAPGGFGR